MKNILLTLALGSVLVLPVLADEADTSTNAPPAEEPHHHGPPGMANLTPEQRDELHKAHDAALEANPGLKAEGKDLMDKMKAYQKKVEAAMIAADSGVAPILAKLDKEHQGHGPMGMGPGGPPPPDDGNPPPPPADNK